MYKYPRTYHLPWLSSGTNDDRISDSVNSLLGINIIITEKLDGSNSSIVKGGVYGRSHVTFSRNPWDYKLRELHSLVKNYLDEGVYLFGEGMSAIHSIEYKNLTSHFYLFGVRDNDIWLSWKDVEEYSYLLDIPTVPVLFEGIVETENELKDIVKSFQNGKSTLGGEREGIVIRNSKSFKEKDFSKNVMKMVRPNHITTDVHWQRNWRKAKIIQ
jgi:hypothetical protein